MGNRVRWACRRGMLELDLLLESFFDNCYANLKEEKQQKFVKLLEENDNDLFNWLLQKEQPAKEHQEIVKDILSAYITES